jgi:hypothetical protein
MAARPVGDNYPQSNAGRRCVDPSPMFLRPGRHDTTVGGERYVILL